MRGLSSKTAQFTFKKLEVIYIIHQMKEIDLLYLLTYLVSRKNEEVENCVKKKVFDYILFLIAHISTNLVIDGLQFWMHVTNLCIKRNVSQIFVFGFSLHFMQKNVYLFV